MLSSPAIAALAAVVLGTSFLAGVFGMAGGMILMGVLLWLLPVPAAMVLHGVIMMAANGWRALLWWRFAHGGIVLRFGIGTFLALAIFSLVMFVPSRPLVFIVLGAIPFVTVAIPENYAPRMDRRGAAEFCGFVGTILQFLSGVSGPFLDSFFVRMRVDRRVVVATKAACQIMGHAVKLVYFGAIVSTAESAVSFTAMVVGVSFAVLGTTLARTLLDRLTDVQFRLWQKRLVLAIGSFYLAYGLILLFG